MSTRQSGPRFRFAPAAFIISLLLLAFIGTLNQNAYRRQTRLLDYKSELQSLNSTLRLEAAHINGPVVIGNWAREQGMIPAPQGTAVREIAPQPVPPRAAPLTTGLEVQTIWR